MQRLKHTFWAGIAILFALCAGSWEGHFMITHAALSSWQSLRSMPLIQTESLSEFVADEKQGLTRVLASYETWAHQNISEYPELPNEIVFNGDRTPKEQLVENFLLSLRINPELTYPNFVLYPKEAPQRIGQAFGDEELKELPLRSLIAREDYRQGLKKVLPGEPISALEVLVAASEEVDHGMDLGLWQDSGTWYGAQMGMGPQPFGNETSLISSQAPWHMGFFHESPLIYGAYPLIKGSYPEYRISLFTTLARFAFSTGHDYWGYRFLGWALHYVQDLAQPFHAKLAPGMSLVDLAVTHLAERFGFRKPMQNMRQLLTNRHFALENYQYFSLLDLNVNHPLKDALRKGRHDPRYPLADLEYPRATVALESYNSAEVINALLIKALPARFVKDPRYVIPDEDEMPNLRQIAFKRSEKNALSLEEEFLNLMSATGVHTRNMIEYVWRSVNNQPGF